MSSKNQTISERFIEGIWSRFHSEKDLSWVSQLATSPINENEIGGDLGLIVNEMLSKGVHSADIARLIRITEHNIAYDILYYLDDFESDGNGPLDSEVPLEWHLALTDEDGNLVDLLDVSCERLSDYSKELEWTSLVPRYNPRSVDDTKPNE